MASERLRARRVRDLLFLSAVAAGLGLLTPNPAAGHEPAKKAGPVPRVSRVTPDEAAGAVEVSAAIDPTNPDHMVAVSIARMREHRGITDFAYVTNDAGRTWKMVPRDNPHAVQQGDDVVTFTPGGVAVHAFISFAGIRQPRPRKAHSGIVTSTSRDGVTWDAQVPVVEHFNSVEPHEDKPWVRADVSKDSPHRGNLYVAWTRFDVYGSPKPEHKSHIYFSRSLDSGKSFAAPIKISDQPGDARDKSDTLMGACPAIGPKGEVYVVWTGPKSVFLTKSTDAGLTFGKNAAIADCAGWDFPVAGLGRASGNASMGVDLTKGKDRGSLYVCWADGRNGDPDVFLATSRDGGETWGKPVRVNNDAKGNGREQWFPWLVVDPVDGSVNIAYYDRGAREGTLTDVTLARSVDGGRTFAYYKLNESAYDLSKLGFFGDYLGIDCYDGRVAVLWMHPVNAARKLGISSAVLDFEPGTQEARAEKKAPAPTTSESVEQKEQGAKAAPEIVASFDGLGEGFTGPQGTATFRNPSDNSLAVGPDHIVQIVNSRMAIFTKKGKRFDTTGKVLYGPVNTGNVFKGFGDFGDINGGDAVVRYDQLADRWLIVLPIFRRLPFKKNEPPGKAGGPAQVSLPGVEGQPGEARLLYQPKPDEKPAGPKPGPRPRAGEGSYAMCYAVSTGPDPLGSYYRYIFERPLFPDYPRPAVWPDGYYVPTSTGDNVIQKHAYVADRAKMLKGEPATEQGVIIDDVNFLNCADLDGKQLPPAGAPNILMATGGAQLKKVVKDDGIYVWKFHVDWADPSRTKLDGPVKIPVAPYEYLGGGQLTSCVPQKGTERRLDAQGDKIMARLVYRRVGDRESIVAAHSVNTSAGGGGVRWYEFRLDGKRDVKLYQQGTYAPGGSYRWMASPAVDALGNIGIGYSFGGASHFPGQRFAGRLSDDPLGVLTLREAVLVEGEAAQTNSLRWEDYAQTAIDPGDDRTIWYVGDYLKKGATNYSTRIGAFRLGADPKR
jgi:hypothetical protein